MSESKDKFRSLVEGLYLRTSDGSMKWTNYENSESFYTPIGGSNIEISKGENSRGETLVVISIYNGEGKVVDSFSDEFFGEASPIYYSGGGYFSLMTDLYDMAKRNASGADLIIQDILNKINAPNISDEVPF
jgi:hypothetical protein